MAPLADAFALLVLVALAVVAFEDVERAAAERAATCLLEARWWRNRAIRFCARAFSVTCPLALALAALLVLDARANEPLDRPKIETKKTKSRRRSVIGVTVTWVPGKISLLPLNFRGCIVAHNIEGQKEHGFDKDRRENSALIGIVSETFRRVQLLILLVLK